MFIALACWGSAVPWAAEEALTQPVDPLSAVWLGVKETWFVVDRTVLLYWRDICRP